MQGPILVHAGLGSRLGASVDSRAEWVLARSGHGSAHVRLFAENAILVGSSGELAGRGSRSWSLILHQVQNFN